MSDDGNFWEEGGADCPSSKRWVIFGIVVLIGYPLFSGAVLWYINEDMWQFVGQFTGYNTWRHIKTSMQKGVAIFQLWEHKRWQATIESFPLFFMCIYFSAEILDPKKGDDCTNDPSDGRWVYVSLVSSAFVMMLIFKREDTSLLPTTLYETHENKIANIEDVVIFQDEADDTLMVAKDPGDTANNPLRKDDIITKIANIDFTQMSQVSDDGYNDVKELWAQERHRLQTTPNVTVVYKRERENSASGLAIATVLLFCWRLCQIACRMLAVVFYYKTKKVTHTMGYLGALLIISWAVRIVSKYYEFNNNSRMGIMDIVFYGLMNLIMLDLRYLFRFEIASLPNFMVSIDFFVFYLTYAVDTSQDLHDPLVVVLIAVLFFITIVGLYVIFRYAEISSYVNVRNRNMRKLLKSEQYQLIEALIMFRAITVADLRGKDSAPKVILIVGQNEAVDQDQLIDALYTNRSEYEERVKNLFLKELCVRLQEGLELKTDQHCPRISVETLRIKLEESFAIQVESKIIQKFFDRVNKKESKTLQTRSNYKTLAPIWQTKAPANDLLEDNANRLMPVVAPTLNADPSTHVAYDEEDPHKTEAMYKDEVSLDILCGYIVDNPVDRFIATISKILFHISVESNPRVDRSLSLHLNDYLLEKKNEKMSTPDVPPMSLPTPDVPPMTSIDDKLFLQTVPCLKLFPNVQFESICDSLKKNSRKISNRNASIDADMIYIIKQGKVRLEDEKHKFILKRGDWFGKPMMSWSQPPKFYVHEALEIYGISEDDYKNLVADAKDVDPNFVDYVNRLRPDYSKIEEYMQKDRSAVVSDELVHNPEPGRTPKRRTRKRPDKTKEDMIRELFKSVPSFGCLFNKEINLLAKFAVTESVKKSSRESPLDDFLFITERGIAKLRRNKQEIDPPLPCRCINLKSFLEDSQKFTVQTVGSTPLGMILVPEDVFRVVVKPCYGVLEKIVALRDVQMPKSVKWNERLYKRVKVGAGGFANVYLMEDKESKQLYAMKRTSKGHIQQNRMFDWVLQEQYCMYMVRHDFVISLLGSLQDEQFAYLLLDYCPGNSLFDLLMHERLENPDMEGGKDGSYYLKESHARFYAACAILGLEALHKRRIVHRDIKSDNMLIDRDGYLVLTDLGFAKPIGEGLKTFTICGTKEYFSPELVNKRGYDFGVDWWALGVSIYDMMTGYIPFDNPRRKLRQANIDKGGVNLYLHSHLSDPARGMLRGLLQFNERDRFGHSEQGGITFMKNHSFFTCDAQFNWAGLETRQLKAPWVPEPKKIDRPNKRLKDAPFKEYTPRSVRSDPFHDYLGTTYDGNVRWKTKPKSKH